MIVLNNGIHVHTIPNEQFKTMHLVVRFTAPVSVETMSKRSLIANLLETNSATYPTIASFHQKLASLYGASFHTQVSRVGEQHHITLSLRLIQDQYTPDHTQLCHEGLSWLNQVIFSPFMVDGTFDLATYQRQKENLMMYYASLKDDKQTYARLALQDLYFDQDQAQAIPSSGTASLLAQSTPEDVSAYYQRMLQEDLIDIFILGADIEHLPQSLEEYFPFPKRLTTQYPNLFYKKSPTMTLRTKTEIEPLNQAKLNLAYHTGIFYNEEDYFKLLMWNGIFGGFSHSKLFTTVREKHSLAYYVSSQLDSYRGMMMVQTGIDPKHKERVCDLIEEILLSMKEDHIDQTVLKQTQMMLMNQYLSRFDYPLIYIEDEFMKQQSQVQLYSPKAWCDKLLQVTPSDIAKITEQVKLAAVYTLKGRDDDDENSSL